MDLGQELRISFLMLPCHVMGSLVVRVHSCISVESDIERRVNSFFQYADQLPNSVYVCVCGVRPSFPLIHRLDLSLPLLPVR